MVWFSCVALSFAVLIGAYIAPAAIAPAASVALTSDSPPGFLLLWTRYSAHLAFAFLLLAFSASTLQKLPGCFTSFGLCLPMLPESSCQYHLARA